MQNLPIHMATKENKEMTCVCVMSLNKLL